MQLGEVNSLRATFIISICDNRDAGTYGKRNLFCLPPGEPEHWGAVSIKDLKNEDPLAVDAQHDARLGPLLREHPMEVDTILCQLLAHLKDIQYTDVRYPEMNTK